MGGSHFRTVGDGFRGKPELDRAGVLSATGPASPARFITLDAGTR
jgi:hypothetical protein